MAMDNKRRKLNCTAYEGSGGSPERDFMAALDEDFATPGKEFIYQPVRNVMVNRPGHGALMFPSNRHSLGVRIPGLTAPQIAVHDAPIPSPQSRVRSDLPGLLVTGVIANSPLPVVTHPTPMPQAANTLLPNETPVDKSTNFSTTSSATVSEVPPNPLAHSFDNEHSIETIGPESERILNDAETAIPGSAPSGPTKWLAEERDTEKDKTATESDSLTTKISNPTPFVPGPRNIDYPQEHKVGKSIDRDKDLRLDDLSFAVEAKSASPKVEQKALDSLGHDLMLKTDIQEETSIRGRIGRPKGSRSVKSGAAIRGRPRGRPRITNDTRETTISRDAVRGKASRARPGLLSATARQPARPTAQKRHSHEYEAVIGRGSSPSATDYPPHHESGQATKHNQEHLDNKTSIFDGTISSSWSTRPGQGSRHLNKAGNKKRGRPSSDAIVCRHCERGPSPKDNQIVFCSACNTPYHQFCHDRPIPKKVTQVADLDWFCAECVIAQNIKAREKSGSGYLSTKSISRRTGLDMRMSHRHKYFDSLDKTELVHLLLKVTAIHSDIPLYRLDETSSNFVGHPLSTKSASDQLNDFESTQEESQASLPRPHMGNGIAISLERDYSDLLVDENKDVWSHAWLQDGQYVGGLAGIRVS